MGYRAEINPKALIQLRVTARKEVVRIFSEGANPFHVHANKAKRQMNTWKQVAAECVEYIANDEVTVIGKVYLEGGRYSAEWKKQGEDWRKTQDLPSMKSAKIVVEGMLISPNS